VDPLRAREGSRRPDHPRGCDDDVERHVVRRHRNVVVHDLEIVHGGHDRRRVVDAAEPAGERVLEVAVAAALAQPRALRGDRDAARHDEVDPSELLRVHRLAKSGRPLDGRGLGEAGGAEATRVQSQEAPRRREPRHGHEHLLALT
jgi:hypothetical protein